MLQNKLLDLAHDITEKQNTIMINIKHLRDFVLTNYSDYIDLSHNLRFEDDTGILIAEPENKKDLFANLQNKLNCLATEINCSISTIKILEDIKQIVQSFSNNFEKNSNNDTECDHY